jgi:hypothetical protein
MHSVAEGHVAVVSAFCPMVFAAHDVPLSVVAMTDVPPTATQELAPEHAMADNVPTPVGTLYWVHVVPPSAETSTIPVLNVVSPTA